MWDRNWYTLLMYFIREYPIFWDILSGIPISFWAFQVFTIIQ